MPHPLQSTARFLRRVFGTQQIVERLDTMQQRVGAIGSRYGEGPNWYGRGAEIRHKLSANGLFIIGHARSGTSVLHTALNLSPDIFLLGEASLHCHHDKKGFAQWYGSMHAANGLPPWKCYSCPVPTDPDGDGFDVLLEARRSYKYIGEKLAFRHPKISGAYQFGTSYDFLLRHFWKSHYVCALRNPLDTLCSSKRVFSPRDLTDYAASYLMTLAFILDICMTFDNSYLLFLEDIGADHFAKLGQRLGCDTSRCYLAYHDEARQPGRYAEHREWIDNAILQRLDHYYSYMRTTFSDTFQTPAPVASVLVRMQMAADLSHLDKHGAFPATVQAFSKRA